ncbi:cell division protein PerM [Curtobacterium sp. Leaf261]|uniref:cell division protein PerM n=1 Tax=Curtobacterium sp. Leaf261 TaxID=1736311 RepID=UPI0006FF892D|nr:DUF6350 family protein [Curtobacterium sp. Leaf261]KQO63550.1 hypothetical protein ASF23_04745 [Curtobacterium sp. Leaf261]
MNRPATALFAAVEAVIAVAVGIGVALVPLTLLWGIEYGLQIPWVVFWRAAASIWLLGHGVDVTFVLDAATASATGLPGAGAPIVMTIAALGFAVVTAWLGARAGRRLAETEHRATGTVTGIAVVVALSFAIAASSISIATRPSLWQSIVLPALWYGVPLIAAAEIARRRRGASPDPVTARILDLVDRIPTVWRAIAGVALRGGTMVVAIVVAVAGVLVGFLVLGSYAEVITLYEQSHAGVLGGLAITVGQLAFLPDFLGWAVSWIVGPGFAIGTGSNVSPIGTTLGPIPGIPVFGALPTSGHSFGLLWVLVPVVGSFLVSAFLRPRLVRALGTANDTAGHRALAGAGTGIVGGVLVGLVAWVSSGSFGPGRLATVGAQPLLVGLFAALEIGVPAAMALAVGSDLVRLRDRDTWLPSRERWQTDGHPDDEPRPVVLAGSDTMTHEADGGFIGALGRAGASDTRPHGRRFRTEEPGTKPTVAAAEHAPGHVPERADGEQPEIEPDAQQPGTRQPGTQQPGTEQPDRDAVPERTSLVDRASAAGAGAAGLAGDAKNRVSALLANAMRARRAGRAAGVDQVDGPGQPAGATHDAEASRASRPPRSGRLDTPNASSRPEATADVPTAWPGAELGETEPAAGVVPRRPAGFTASTPIQRPAPAAEDEPDDWDTGAVDDVPEHELPWWRRPKGDG